MTILATQKQKSITDSDTVDRVLNKNVNTESIGNDENSNDVKDTSDNELNPHLTKTEAIIEWIEQRIEWHIYKPNQRVPSVRKLAKKLSVSSFTVSQAYEQLVATNVLSAKQGSGYFVAAPNQSRHVAKAIVANTNKIPMTIDTRWLVRQMFSDIPLHRAPGSGIIPKEWVRNSKMEWAIRQIANQSNDFIYSYGNIQGYLPLREHMVKTLNTIGMNTTVQNVLTTAGVSQAVILVGRLLQFKSDTVIVDDPGWYWLSGALQQLGLNVVSVKRDHLGPDIEQLRHIFESAPISNRPKLYLTNSVLHNPTSYILHPARAHQVLNLMHEFDAYIFEDDLYASLLPDNTALRYASLDQFERVFYATGFSKYMASGWRVGMLVCPEKYIDDIIAIKTLSNMTTPEFGERVIYRLWTHGESRRQLKKLQEHLYDAHQYLRNKLTLMGIEYPEHTHAGMFVWIDTGVDTAKLALKAHTEGWLIAPGQLFNPNGRASTYMRINVATTSDEFLEWLNNSIKTIKKSEVTKNV